MLQTSCSFPLLGFPSLRVAFLHIRTVEAPVSRSDSALLRGRSCGRGAPCRQTALSPCGRKPRRTLSRRSRRPRLPRDLQRQRSIRRLRHDVRRDTIYTRTHPCTRGACRARRCRHPVSSNRQPSASISSAFCGILERRQWGTVSHITKMSAEEDVYTIQDAINSKLRPWSQSTDSSVS